MTSDPQSGPGAAWRLVVVPFVWDKTPHEQDRDRIEPLDDEDAGREAA